MLPAKLKNYILHNDGNSYVGMIPEVATPKIAMAGEDYRAGGMLGPVKMDMGLEALEQEMTLGGLDVGVMRQMGMTRADGVLMRFTGAYQSDQSGGVSSAEYVVRGRHAEFDPGTAKTGDDTAWKVKSSLTYLKWTVNGTVEIEIDLINCVYLVGGVDRMAEIRAAIGMGDGPLDSLVSGPRLNIPGLGGFGIPGL